MEEAKDWLKEQVTYTVTLWDGVPIAVVPPNIIELEVVQSDPGIKGDTATGATKPAILSTGAQVKVPLFVSVGDVLRIDTRTRAYVGRAKS